ncbi:MAG: hypothetical protein KF873_19005 [Gemmataceae bacterium]|nr:hypothetical protein [Gemmataceae bacterium]
MSAVTAEGQHRFAATRDSFPFARDEREREQDTCHGESDRRWESNGEHEVIQRSMPMLTLSKSQVNKFLQDSFP